MGRGASRNGFLAVWRRRGGGSGAENGQKCLQNDLFGLKMARSGAGNGENGLETTKCAKNAKNRGKTAENEGANYE